MTTPDLPLPAPVAPARLQDEIRALATRDPIDSLATVVLGGAFLFFLAEHGKNPKVTSYQDALLFIATSMSVGYADIYPKTPVGKSIAAFVMSVGPALTTRALDPPAKR